MTSLDNAWLAPEQASYDALPHPNTDRWQPLRLGLVDLFYYDDEQFWFHDGRLLLRGNNGTGKSKVLALTLPFLLDGSIQPRRVEPDADPKKRMEWNLLLGGAHTSTERTGYSWIEFGRRDADGTEHFITLGIGLKAAAGRGIVKTWYFTTTRRIGDLRLLDENRTVLTQERLRDAIVGTGQVHTTQEAYRRAVDEALFRLGEERYAALIDLLIQLRQPQLSKRPDEKALSAALTEALAPLDQAVVADVAESFRSLEEERSGIEDARDTLKAADDFLEHYRAYARVAARRHTTGVRVANSTFEHAGRNLREAEGAFAAAVAEVDRLDGAKVEAEERQGALHGQDQALRQSPEMRDAERLDQAEREARNREEGAEAAREEVVKARSRATRDAEDEGAAEQRHQQALTAVREYDARALGLARSAGLAAEHASIAGDADAAHRSLTRRREQITLVRRLADKVRTAQDRASNAHRVLDSAESGEASRAEGVQRATEEVAEAVVGYRERVRDYLGSLEAVVPSEGADELTQRAEGWAQSLAGESPAATAVEAAAAQALADLGRQRATAEHEATRLDEELASVRGRIGELEAGRDAEPPGTPGREAGVRAGVAGAPLWRVTDFADGVSDTERAGLEAALQSAGLLDAWLFPDGRLAADGDVVLGPGGAMAARSVSAVLVASVGPDEVVTADVVSGVLARIGLGEASQASIWVDSAGHWGAGPARGTWAKDRAEYVGAAAREAYRREMLAGLLDEADRLADGIASVHEVIAGVERLTVQVKQERSSYPAATERDLVAAHERVAAAGRELDRARAAVESAREAWEQEAAAAQEAADELAEAATDLGTGTTPAELEEAMDAVRAYSEALLELRTAAGSVVEAEATRAAAADRAAESASILAERESAARELRGQATTLRAHADALHGTVGASVAELQARLGAITKALETVAGELKHLTDDQLKAAVRRGQQEEKVNDLGQRRREATAERELKVDALRGFAATGLLRVALPELEAPDPDATEAWNLTAAVALARTAEQHLDGSDDSDEAWAKVQQRISNASQELSTQMSRHGHTSFLEPRGDVMVARVRYLSEDIDVDRLASRLSADLEQRERLLSAREREILENHLVNEVAGHLHELLLHAQESIDRMNRELADRKTSTGMQLRVGWRERRDGPTGLSAARDLMFRSDATWTPQDRSAIGEFLQARIAEVREADPAGGWQEHLEQALDYRQWHSFVVERYQNGQWRSATGPASGGERVLAMSVPLFAAASSHYNSAGAHAPRLILLDEAFAGVDDDSRAKSLGLLATFDLDVVMTSEREWGCYPQVPGLAISQLSRVEGVDAVGVTRWRWDGRRRSRLDEVEVSARASTPGDEPSSAEESLFR